LGLAAQQTTQRRIDAVGAELVEMPRRRRHAAPGAPR
jgi:hypothetical protein